MATMNVSLPAAMKAWVEEQVQTGRYGNSSDYVRDLVRRDQERAAKLAEFERLVQEGIDSGISPLTPEEVFANARRKAGVKTSDAA
ncbi:MAG: type II toxin-antitoxin system ParD family antitoxin [Devosia sp.]|jgi:antitoxin ParD1/3/4|nr:type II toxin-antitoxin system ParD family antitoxin [Alphaproteobacteria bacterium]MBU1560288.1 type II toxin-antitoxin system ParD family antitoxin [Alphaproteobacteria bacterium]MBU2303613.1 type II toxin-antitoxin system ParD family antitoxin [Alphaproteobacteria bacterium]MBU2366212.1 type II toxin-antitoxin system ParD family antitoxin [Alphaproteobacteria bacterium]